MHFKGRASIVLEESTIESYDAIIISTDHDSIDYTLIAKHGHLLIDHQFSRAGLPFRAHNTELCQVSSERIDGGGWLSDEKIPCTMKHQHTLLFDRLHGNEGTKRMPGRLTA
jgi:hypothetical protein